MVGVDSAGFFQTGVARSASEYDGTRVNACSVYCGGESLDGQNFSIYIMKGAKGGQREGGQRAGYGTHARSACVAPRSG